MLVRSALRPSMALWLWVLWGGFIWCWEFWLCFECVFAISDLLLKICLLLYYLGRFGGVGYARSSLYKSCLLLFSYHSKSVLLFLDMFYS